MHEMNSEDFNKVSKKLEKFSIIKALRSMDRCDVALIVLDAVEGMTDQDVSVAGHVCSVT